ncbi:MAG: aspartate ammonia-lyase [Gammaproteobacteria bacterium]|nr:aspartate ammonia-lyase [Gammaproteobacteria bacterium]
MASQNEYTRDETDSLGTVSMPRQSLYGSNTARALENFPIDDRILGQEPALVKALAKIKKACALANVELDRIEESIGHALVQACDEMIDGQLNQHLLVPVLEGSGGTSTNMNVNEVLANRALQLIGKIPGDYSVIHPNDHVNQGQSTNDVLPSAIKLACYELAQEAKSGVEIVALALTQKAGEFSEVYRLGRTCLQDAQPMTLGQAFGGYHSVIDRAASRIGDQSMRLLTIPLGGTAIGTGLGSAAGFQKLVFEHLRDVSGLPVVPSANRFDGMQNLDEFQRLSAELETATGAMAKIAKDFIILSSGPSGGLAEISLPAVQPGSSIMPGKVNPVIPMSTIQLAQLVHGNHCCIVMACQDGLLEINHFEHSVASRLFDSLHRISEIATTFATHCIDGIEANEARSMDNLTQSFALATTLVPKLGYSAVSAIVKESVKTKRAFLEVAVERDLIARDEILDIIKSSVRID